MVRHCRFCGEEIELIEEPNAWRKVRPLQLFGCEQAGEGYIHEPLDLVLEAAQKAVTLEESPA